MHILVIDNDPASRAAIYGRVQLAARQAEIRRIEIVDLDLPDLRSFDTSAAVGCLIGPESYSGIEEVLEQIKACIPDVPMGIVLENEVYAADAVVVQKQFDLKAMPLGDLAQIAGFLIECEKYGVQAGGPGTKGVAAVAHLKGGVGATTVASALAGCWVRHGLSCAAVDLDDVNPQLTGWGRVGAAQRTVTAEFLRHGQIPRERLNELLNPVDGFDSRLVMVGQPERYKEGFHFKADVIERAPSSADFINSLIPLLQEEFDSIVIDLGRSWGVAAFSVLPLCQSVLLVTDDDGMSVRRTLDNLLRLKRESDDPDEFDLSRWSVVLNAYTGRLVTPRDLATEIQEMELLPPEANLFTLPFSEKGRQWGAPGETFFDLADENARESVIKIAASIVPFRYAEPKNLKGRVGKKFENLFGRSS